jgi:hypothetical protein
MTPREEPGPGELTAGATGQGPLERDEQLGDGLRAIVDEPQLRDCFRALFAHELATLNPGWPCQVDPAALSTWLRAGDVAVELARSPAREPLALLLVLPAESAVRLVDAVLGAPASSAIASASGQPSEAECGVLAYAAARLLAAQRSPGWVLRDVRPAADVRPTTSMVVWPVALAS